MFFPKLHYTPKTLFCTLAIIGLADPIPSAFASSSEISVSCGDANTSTAIRTRRQLQNARAIRIVVDPANKCHVEISIELKDESGNHRNVAARPRKPVADKSAGDKPSSQCFNFAGRRYCE